MLAEYCKFHDVGCVNLFRHGAEIIGPLTCSGNGVPVDVASGHDIEQLVAERPGRNARMLAKVRVDVFADELLEQTRCDVALGRMSEPAPVERVDLGLVSICQRFSVLQGMLHPH